MRFFGFISICFFLLSCDPTYVIAIQNNSNEIIKLKAQVNQRFHSNNYDSIFITYLDNNWIEAFIKPKQQLDCGYAIAELDNDIPFNELKIFINNDSIVAKNQKEVLKLLDNRGVFKVMTPYILEID
jgi:hypothetical protein